MVFCREEQYAMLHTDDDDNDAFCWALLRTAKWLWSLYQTPEEQSTMLHAIDNYAFRWGV